MLHFLSKALSRENVVRLLRTLWLLLGPGLLVMFSGNDAGGVITYAQTGATYGFNLFVPLVCLLIPVAYLIQEMTIRLGAVTKRGHGELIFEKFGRFWGYFSLVELTVGNLLTVVTEFIGMSAALAYFGVTPYIGVPLSAIAVIAIVLFCRYWTMERIVIVFAISNVVFIPLAFMAHGSFVNILLAFTSLAVPGGLTSSLIFAVIANIGTTIAPWMIFYQQSAVVDRGITPEEISSERKDTAIGGVLMGVIAIAIMAITTWSLHGVVDVSTYDTHAYLTALDHHISHTVGTLFAIGLFEAGFIAAINVSLSSAWAMGEVFKWNHTVNAKPSEAKPFYWVYVLTIVFAAGFVLLPHMPLSAMTQLAQVVETMLMPPALIMLLLLLNNKKMMGKYINSKLMNIIAIVIVAIIVLLSIALCILTFMNPS